MLLVFAVLDGAATPVAPVADVPEDEVQRLVLAARGGDREAARRLYRLHATRLWRAVQPLCDADADAEDVVQDTFIKAFGALDRYEARPGVRFISWLSTIAMNTARKRARKLGRLKLVEPVELGRAREAAAETSEDPAGEGLDRAKHRQALLRALDELPERDRQVVSLRYGADLSAAEVARALDLGEANVRKICERRRTSLETRIRALLEERPS